MLIAQYQLTANEFQPLQHVSISIQLDRQKNNLITFVQMMLYHPINTVVNKRFRKTYQMKEMLSPIPTMIFQPPDFTGEHYNARSDVQCVLTFKLGVYFGIQRVRFS